MSVRKQSPVLLTVVGVALCLASNPPQASARASVAIHDHPWSSAYIDELPSEVRAAALQMCPERPNASRYFATYSEGAKVVRLNFEHFDCRGQDRLCRDGTACLQVEFISSGSGYRLLKRYYSRGDN
jgi:hypothetical protein